MQNISSILLVDDDDTSNFVNKTTIQHSRLSDNIHVTKNGKEALDFLKVNCSLDGSGNGQCPSLIFLDINMPVMDGIEFLHSLEGNKDINMENTHIVILTSSENIRDVNKTLQFNVAAYINKPLTETKVKEVINFIF